MDPNSIALSNIFKASENYFNSSNNFPTNKTF